MTLLHYISLLTILGVSLAATGCKENGALSRAITCAQVQQIRAGMTPVQVHAILGGPALSLGTGPTNIFDARATHYDRYHYAAPDRFDHVDWLSTGYAGDALIYVVAERNYSDRVFDRASGHNPVLAYRLSTTSGREHREIGPEFDRVFDCRTEGSGK